MKTRDETYVTVVFPDDLLTRAKAIARVEGGKVEELIVDAVRECVDRIEQRNIDAFMLNQTNPIGDIR